MEVDVGRDEAGSTEMDFFEGVATEIAVEEESQHPNTQPCLILQCSAVFPQYPYLEQHG